MNQKECINTENVSIKSRLVLNASFFIFFYFFFIKYV